MKNDIGTQLVEFAVKTKYENIPEEIIDFTKGLTLKTIAGMLAGSTKPSSQKMAGLIKGKKSPSEVGVAGSGFKTSLWEGVLLNSYFSHACELEDDRWREGVSWDITVIPLLFPLAEKYGLSGRSLMEALVVGLEVHTRTCLFDAWHLGLNLVPGAVGPAVGAAKALGLGVKETSAAFGLALSGVPLAIINLGTDAHYFESALMALQGVMAAEMAQVGLSGNADNISKYLIDYLGKDYVKPKKMVEGLGKKWVLQEIQIKKYPCCIILHRYIDLVIALKKKHNLSFEDVDVIEIHTRGDAEELLNRPEPKNECDLQFSFQHVLAAAMLIGDVNLKHFTPEAVVDRKLRDARSKVKFVVHADPISGNLANATAAFRNAPAHLVIKTKDGKAFSGKRRYALGHPEDPLTMEQFRELYFKFTQDILPEKDISKTAELILNLEKLNNVKKLMDIIRCG
jgi:2-methylcitrate dehydratase PrpD